jgi:hypothetical protein
MAKARSNVWISHYYSNDSRFTEFDGPADSSATFYRVTVTGY